ncbi:MAG: hypothetical protein ACHQ9S_04185 [Candidatus Binatia bacterium]
MVHPPDIAARTDAEAQAGTPAECDCYRHRNTDIHSDPSSDENTDAQADGNSHFHPDADIHPNAKRNYDVHLHRYGDGSCKYVRPPAILGREQLDPGAADGVAGDNDRGINQRGTK